MADLILDASVTLSWFLPAELTSATQQILDRVGDNGALVPVLWPFEVANTLVLAARHRKISTEKRSKALTLLTNLPIDIDTESTMRVWAQTSELAQQFRLTVYDAAYLELALRNNLPLASLDQDLRAAALRMNVPTFGL